MSTLQRAIITPRFAQQMETVQIGLTLWQQSPQEPEVDSRDAYTVESSHWFVARSALESSGRIIDSLCFLLQTSTTTITIHTSPLFSPTVNRQDGISSIGNLTFRSTRLPP